MIEVADGEHPFGRSDGAPGVTVETRSLIYPGIRGSYDDARIVRELRPFLGRELHLKPISPKLLDEASFKAPEYAVLQVLAGEGIRVDEVWLSSAARDAKAVVLALWYLDMLDTFEIPPALMRTPTPAPVVTGAVPQQAAPSSDTSKRIVLDNTPGKMSSSEWAALGAGQTMKVAEGFYRGGDLGRAERAFEAALMAEPQNPRALAFLTWIRLTKAGGSRNTAVNDAMKIFQESVRADQNFGYGYYFMGELLQLRGDGENAEKAFKNAIRVAPDLFEADRQLRLIAMRRKSGRRS
jgi:tetratricopeptide (TPR) repeat protein